MKSKTQSKKSTIDWRKEYFDYLDNTSKVVSKEIRTYFEMFKSDKGFYALLKPLLEKRLKHQQLRPVICRLSYEIVGGKNWKSIVPLCAAMEIQTMYFYYHNWIFDNKNGLWTGRINDVRKKINNVTIAATVTREIISDAINKLNTNPQKKLLLEKLFREANLQLYHGQYLDINLTVDHFDEIKTEEKFLTIYENKNRLLTGQAYALSGYIGAILGNGTKKQTEQIRSICEVFGIGVHVSNDLGDFAPPPINTRENTFSKPYQDQLADIKEGRLTYPIFLILKKGSKKERAKLLSLVGRYKINKKQMVEIAKILHSSGAYKGARQYVNGYYWKAWRMLHKDFGRSDERNLFTLMLMLIKSNKFLRELRYIGEEANHINRKT